MPSVIRKAIQICIETLEAHSEQWSPQDKDEARDCLSHLLIQRFKFDRTDRDIIAAAKAVLAVEPPKEQA